MIQKVRGFMGTWHKEIVELESLYIAEPMTFEEIDQIYRENMAKVDERLAQDKATRA